MDISGIDVCELPFDEVVEMRSGSVFDGNEESSFTSLYESPGYPSAIGSYALIECEETLYREEIYEDGGFLFPVVDRSDLQRIGLI